MSTQQQFDNLMVLLKPAAVREFLCERDSWDRRTHTASKARVHRPYIAAILAKDAYESAMNPAIAGYVEDLLGNIEQLNEWQRLFIKRLDVSLKRLHTLSSEFVARKAEITSNADTVWEIARAGNNFDMFAPHLNNVIKIIREQALLMGANGRDSHSIYDVLLANYEPGYNTDQLLTILSEARDWLVDFIKRVQESGIVVTNDLLRGTFPIDKQKQFCREIAKKLGFDFASGDLDITIHPFCSTVGPDDCRITTRYNPKFVAPALFGTRHEAGHAMFEQGMPAQLKWAVINGFLYSLGIHESQSRLWENGVVRSREVVDGVLLPMLQKYYSDSFTGVGSEDLYRAVNAITPSYIRVEADEVTYNLHVILRIEIEIAFMSGELTVKDIPEAFSDKMEKYLGIRPDSFTNGVLQDIHWGSGYIGYFGTYSLGNFIFPQLLHAYGKQQPDYRQEFGEGNFSSLLSWLRKNVHHVGHITDINSVLMDATGENLNLDYWKTYISDKYGQIYGLN